MTKNKRKYILKQRRFRLKFSAVMILLLLTGLLFCHIARLNPELFRQKTIVSFSENQPENTRLSVTFLDVGQGNCILAESDGHYLLIDGGDRSHSSFVVSYLQQRGITQLDYVLVSHYDADHLSGIIGVLYNYNVATLLTPDYTTGTKIYQSYINCIETQSLAPVHPQVGDSYTLGNASFTVVCPDNYDYDEENNRSLGIRLTDSNNSFLILGDAQSQSERTMLKQDITLSSNVYLVSHHGSASSSSENFLNAVNPQYAVISVGADNDYGHPAPKTLSRLTALHTQILRTDTSGTITAYSTPDGLVWNLQKE